MKLYYEPTVKVRTHNQRESLNSRIKTEWLRTNKLRKLIKIHIRTSRLNNKSVEN